MRTSTATSFYIQRPCDIAWNTGMRNCVIEARPIDAVWEQTDTVAKTMLQVIKPQDFGFSFVAKDAWVECSGPSRRLTFKQYVALYRSLYPEHPLPYQAHGFIKC